MNQFKLAALLPRTRFLRICFRSVHQTHYDVLKIRPNSSSKEVRDAFINLSKQNHPDKHLNDPTMHDRFVKINEAYSVLINPSSRKEYDRKLEEKNMSQGEGATRGAYYYSSSSYRRPGPNPRRTAYYSGTRTREGKEQEFYSYNWEARSDTKRASTSRDSYYGIKGLKKISNTVIVCFLVAFATVTFIVQMMTINTQANKSKDRAAEESRKNSLLLAMAREKVRLYGNEHQINILKESLEKTYEPFNAPLARAPSDSVASDKLETKSSTELFTSPSTADSTGKPCKKCKKNVKPVMTA